MWLARSRKLGRGREMKRFTFNFTLVGQMGIHRLDHVEDVNEQAMILKMVFIDMK